MTLTEVHLRTILPALLPALLFSIVTAWVPTNGGRETLAFGTRGLPVSLRSEKDNGEPKQRGYKFGDLTRALGRKVTGDRNYQIGDISKKLDDRAKDRVGQIIGKEYQLGDISRWADSQIKEKVAKYTGKANYEVGDISKEVVKRAWAGPYDLGDVVLMLRVLLQMGASFTPIAKLLPVKLLLEVLSVGLAQDVGSKLVGTVATTLDERFKEAITGDANYQLGDKTKQELAKSLAQFTGNDTYSFGDVARAVATRLETTTVSPKPSTSKSNSSAMEELINNEALSEWDKKYVESIASENSLSKKQS